MIKALFLLFLMNSLVANAVSEFDKCHEGMTSLLAARNALLEPISIAKKYDMPRVYYSFDTVDNPEIKQAVTKIEDQNVKLNYLLKVKDKNSLTPNDLEEITYSSNILIENMAKILRESGHTPQVKMMTKDGPNRPVLVLDHYNMPAFSKFHRRISQAFRIEQNAEKTVAIYDPYYLAVKSVKGVFQEKINTVRLSAFDFVDEVLFQIPKSITKHEFAHNRFALMKANNIRSPYHFVLTVPKDSSFKMHQYAYSKFKSLEEVYTHAHNFYWGTSRFQKFAKIAFQSAKDIQYDFGNVNNIRALLNDLHQMEIDSNIGAVLFQETPKHIDMVLKQIQDYRKAVNSDKITEVSDIFRFDPTGSYLQIPGKIELKVPHYPDEGPKWKAYRAALKEFEKQYGHIGYDNRIYGKNPHYKELMDTIRGFQRDKLAEINEQLSTAKDITSRLASHISGLRESISKLKSQLEYYKNAKETKKADLEFIKALQKSFDAFRNETLEFAKISRITN